ncbi:MAG: hypothetical protein IJD59_03415 [Clostridia bacterium]|nr:hypothetical protein [Clostridia bacterium]
MKATKKLFALFLAMTVLFTVCSISVFAANTNVFASTEVEYGPDDLITGEGIFQLYPNGRSIEYHLWCYYIAGPVQNLTLYAQCAVIYTDGSSDCYSVSANRVIGPGRNDEVFDYITLPTDKEIEFFSLEFQIHANGVMYWEGYLDVPYSN